MNALRRQNIRPQQTFERWTPRTQESPRELARQSEANVCRRRKCNLKNPPLFIAQDTQKCTEHPTKIRGCVLVPRTQIHSPGVDGFTNDQQTSHCHSPGWSNPSFLGLFLPSMGQLRIVCFSTGYHLGGIIEMPVW